MPCPLLALESKACPWSRLWSVGWFHHLLLLLLCIPLSSAKPQTCSISVCQIQLHRSWTQFSLVQYSTGGSYTVIIKPTPSSPALDGKRDTGEKSLSASPYPLLPRHLHGIESDPITLAWINFTPRTKMTFLEPAGNLPPQAYQTIQHSARITRVSTHC